MIEILPGYPDNILAIPAIEAKVESHGKIRMLYDLDPKFTGFDAAAMWEDATTGLEHFTDFEKIAFGSHADWIKI